MQSAFLNFKRFVAIVIPKKKKKSKGKPNGLLCKLAGSGITPETYRSDRHAARVEKESESLK